MAKKKRVDQKGNYSSDQTLGIIAGCPFTGFGPCTSEKCTFFVAVPDRLTGRECIIKSIYFIQMTHNLLSLLAPSDKTERSPEISLSQDYGWSQRAVESLVDWLDYLDGLAKHPKTGDKLKGQIQTMRSTLLLRLQTFGDGS